ncbi:hypothetical protein DFJ58DRAFT_840914 [Suillus subalutaceus]|uniref:uncharacterized protein n=1 Tax=Suillus subalutaceus TaxID=48586 RepID=UPI001B85E89C|nr:uncharacterized protein DFJ58DRAFT_840914 [Suillus subalutaceus]KAG1856406.1 hypothetical protein DFJ58DRAFT_840914 [Suillus subalutaceus]
MSLVTGYTPSRVTQTAFGVPMSGVSMPTYNARGRTRGTGIMRPARPRVPGSGVTLKVLIVLLPKDLSNVCNEDAPDFMDEDFLSVTRCVKVQEEKQSEREARESALRIPDKETDKEADVQSECKHRADNDNHWKHKVRPSGDYYSKVKPNSEGSTAKGSNNDGVRCNACYKPRGKGYDVPMRALKREKARKKRKSLQQMRTGEELASDLRFLSRYGLTKKLTLQRRNADDYVLADLIKAVTDITIDANICFPSYNPDPLDLAPDELNQDVRTDFHNLPFRFIVPGYSNAHQGQRYLRVDHSFSFQELRFSTFQKKCPKGGPLIGLVEPKSPHQHFCFANRIMGHLVQGFDDTPSVPGRFFTVPWNIRDLFDLSQAIHSSADQAYSDSTLCIEANTVTDAANGMIDVFQHYYKRLSEGGALDSDNLVKHDLTVGDMKSIFSIPVWHFQAGHRNATDSFGNGIMRQVIHTALRKSVSWTSDGSNEDNLALAEGDVCIELDDDFWALKLSWFPSSKKLATIFAIGRLCALHILQVQNGPHPISPALLSFIVNGVLSLTTSESNHLWLGDNLFPTLANIIKSLPTEDENVSNLVMDGFGEIRGTPSERWPMVRRDLICAALLSYSHDEFVNSQEYQAFKDGFDLHVTSSIPSLSEILQPSFSSILRSIYDHHPTADVLENMLCFEVDSDENFRARLSPYLRTFKRAVLKYLNGKGHPRHSIFESLHDDEAMPPHYRALHFVKVLSGIPLVPADPLARFMVNVTQHVPADATFNGHLNPETDLIPPIAHACMLRLDIFMNPMTRTKPVSYMVMANL